MKNSLNLQHVRNKFHLCIRHELSPCSSVLLWNCKNTDISSFPSDHCHCLPVFPRHYSNQTCHLEATKTGWGIAEERNGIDIPDRLCVRRLFSQLIAKSVN